MADLAHASVAELARALAAREVSAVELAKMFLGRMDSRRDLNAFLDVRPEVTLAQAGAADQRRARGEATRSHRRADRPQGHLRHPGLLLDRVEPDSRGLHEPLRRHRGRQPRPRRHGDPRQAQLRRVRDGLEQREQRLRQRAEPLGRQGGPGRFLRRLVGRGSRRASRRSPRPRTPAGRSASRPRSPGSPGPSPPTAGRRAGE